ncbi:MAG: type 1 glutamine amidotransferase [Candidatus Dadabacteria bacterium]|nr:type 1 glutamine amidotransferase [Candidatus Dadabacteria bacterium]
MPRLLVLQHVAHEILGTLDPLLRDAGFRIKYVNFERHPDAEPELEGYDGLIVLGGPMNVDEVDKYPNLETEMNLIKRAVEKEFPILAICLGSQLLAKALGAKVRKNPEKEIGWYDLSPTEEGENDPLISNFKHVERIFQWHGDTFELPEGATLLAFSPLCKNQAFRYGEYVYGFQFHLEVDTPMIERWLRVPENKKEIEDLNGKIDSEQIRVETPDFISRLNELSNSVFGNFIELFGYNKKRKTLPSR